MCDPANKLIDFTEDDDLFDDLMNIVQNDGVNKSTSFGFKIQSETSNKIEVKNKKKNIVKNNVESLDEEETTDTLKDDDDYEEDNNRDENNEYDDEDDEDDAEEMLIDQMLEKPIDLLNDKDQVNFYTYDKIQIKNIYWRGCQDTILPEGWVQVTHACGMPLYLHRQTRVCTLSRPYFISQSSARKHEIPISSIPCLAYRRRKEEVEKQIKEHNQSKYKFNQTTNNANANNINNHSNKGQMPNVKIGSSENLNKCPMSNINNNANNSNNKETPKEPENQTDPANGGIQINNKKVVVTIQTNEEKSKENLLTPEQIHEYCKRLFEFDVIKVKKFKTWGDRKKFIRKSKQKKFPENAKMLKIQTKTAKGINKELNINMTNKTPLSILYEYSTQVFRSNPRFEIQEKENPKDPFLATCYINDKICGKGTGNSKKAAKNNAAEAALCVLIPEFKSQMSDTKKNNDEMYTFFDGYSVEHSHVYLLSQKLGAPLPYDVLMTCLKFNFAINMSRNRKQFIEEDIKPIKYRNCLYKMKLAQYEVEVNCTKKKEGRQLASQKILKLMHPHIQTWGSMLRLYGSRMEESFLKTDNKNEQNEDSDSKSTTDKANKKSDDGIGIAKNDGKAKPNKELLEKLKEEMRKLRKPTVQADSTSTSTSTSSSTDLTKLTTPNLSTDTLLTIPPLKLGNCEFTLSSCSYLMTSSSLNKDKVAADNKLQDTEENDGKILFDNLDENKKKLKTSSSAADRIELEFDKTNSNIFKNKKRKHWNDENSDDDDDDDDDEDSDDDSEDEEDEDDNDDDSDVSDSIYSELKNYKSNFNYKNINNYNDDDDDGSNSNSQSD